MTYPDCRVLLAAALLTVPTVGLATGFPPLPQAHAGARVSVLASGLHDPRGMAIGPDGRLYVAEAGTTEGRFVPPLPPAPAEPPTRTRCEVYWPVGPATPGATGRISRIDLRSGQVRTVADQLPSMGANTLIGGDRSGVGALAFLGDRLYATLAGAGCSHGHPSDPNALLRVFRDGTTVAIADLSNYLRTMPDSKNPADGDYEPDGVWFNLVRAFGALYAVEPNRGVFVRIERSGAITPVADMIAAVAAIDPAGDGDQTFSALTKHAGAFYLGTLGRIDSGFAGAVYRVSRDGRRVRQVASGVRGVLGVAFDRLDRMYVLETTAAGVDPPLSDPTAGRLVRVERDGSLTPILTGLAFPTALIAGPDGDFYVTQCGYHCDDRSTFPPALPSLRAGQVLRVRIPGSPAHCDDEENP